MRPGRIVAAELGLTVAYTDAGLRERQYGIFEGLTRTECETQHADAWRAWVAGRTVPPGGESNETFTARLMAALGRVVERVPPFDLPALVVAHGGAMRAMIATLSIDVVPPLANGALWVIAWERGIVSADEL